MQGGTNGDCGHKPPEMIKHSESALTTAPRWWCDTNPGCRDHCLVEGNASPKFQNACDIRGRAQYENS